MMCDRWIECVAVRCSPPLAAVQVYNTPLGGCGGNYDYYKSGAVSMYVNVGVGTSYRIRSRQKSNSTTGHLPQPPPCFFDKTNFVFAIRQKQPAGLKSETDQNHKIILLMVEFWYNNKQHVGLQIGKSEA